MRWRLYVMSILSSFLMQKIDNIQNTDVVYAGAETMSSTQIEDSYGCRNECSGSCENSCYGSCEFSCDGGCSGAFGYE